MTLTTQRSAVLDRCLSRTPDLRRTLVLLPTPGLRRRTRVVRRRTWGLLRIHRSIAVLRIRRVGRTRRVLGSVEGTETTTTTVMIGAFLGIRIARFQWCLGNHR